MRRTFIFCFLILGSYVFADTIIKDFFNLKQYPCKKVAIKYRGTYDYLDIKDKDFEECWLYLIEKINGIDTILYYPSYNNKTNLRQGKIQINEQAFILKDSTFDISEIEFYSVNYKEKIYLFLLGNIGKYGNKVFLLFDITNPENIVFYPPEKKFICKEVSENFVGLYQNKLCFLFSIWDSDTKLEYKLIPYYVEDNVLKMLCDDKGDVYYVKYYFLDRFEQQIEFKEEYLPNDTRLIEDK